MPSGRGSRDAQTVKKPIPSPSSYGSVWTSSKRISMCRSLALIDTIAIDKARTGIYPIGIAKDITETRLKRFFIKEESTYPYNDSYR